MGNNQQFDQMVAQLNEENHDYFDGVRDYLAWTAFFYDSASFNQEMTDFVKHLVDIQKQGQAARHVLDFSPRETASKLEQKFKLSGFRSYLGLMVLFTLVAWVYYFSKAVGQAGPLRLFIGKYLAVTVIVVSLFLLLFVLVKLSWLRLVHWRLGVVVASLLIGFCMLVEQIYGLSGDWWEVTIGQPLDLALIAVLGVVFLAWLVRERGKNWQGYAILLIIFTGISLFARYQNANYQGNGLYIGVVFLAALLYAVIDQSVEKFKKA